MSDDILFFLLGAVVSFIGGYFFGRISMLGTIVKAVVEESEKELTKEQTPNILTVEKHNDMYYAYVDGNFASQGTSFDDLFTALKSNKDYSVVNINRTTAAGLHLDKDEARLMAESIGKIYGKKE